MTRNTKLVLVLLAVACWATWALWPGDEPLAGGTAAVAEDRASGRKGKDLVTAEKVPVVVSRLAEPGTGEVFVRERNLFEHAQSPEEVQAIEEQRRATVAAQKVLDQQRSEAVALQVQKDREAEDARRIARELAMKKAREADLLNPPKPIPPSFPYQYVGIIGPVENPFAVLSAPDRSYRYVRAGESIDAQFKLEYIAQQRLDLSYTDKQFQDQFTQVQRLSDASATRTR